MILFPKFMRDVLLMVETDRVEEITTTQRRSIAEFLEWPDQLFRNLEAPIYRYYRQFIELTGLNEPKIDSPSGVWPHVYPSTIIIPEYENGDNTYVQIELNCDWEVEHGMEWDIRNAKDVLYVGPFEGNSFGSLEKNGPSGYVLGSW